ncbi:MAG: prolyl oligopeptidase family serine peptidase, partial [Pyrinomonadaceae bacterium]|nr:prolyl oligopeptidase family serine peptidase [Pyrinomonadaceae bacterium]
MKNLLCVFAFIIIIVSGGRVIIIAQDMKPPVAKKEPKVLKIHGYEITDNYAWLRSGKDEKGKVRKEVEDYLVEENKYTENFMAGTKDFQDALYKEMLGKIKQTDMSLPTKIGNYWYYTKTQEGKQYPIFCRSTKEDKSDEQVTLDQNEMAKGYQYFAIGAYNISDDGNILAFSTDTTGYRQYTLQFKDLRTGQILSDKIERVTSLAWAADNKTLMIGTENQTDKRSDQIWRYELGSNKPELIFEEKDVLFNTGVGKTRDRKYFYIQSGAATMTEIRMLSTATPKDDWKMILPREKDHEYDVEIYEDTLYITTNKNALNSRIVTTSLKDTSEKTWKDFIPHNPNAKINGISFFKGYGVVSGRENGLEFVRVIDMKTKKSKNIKADESIYTIGLGGNPEFDTPTIRYGYASMITPSTTYEYNFKTGKSKMLKQQEVLGGYDKTKYETTRVWATARDGVKVPVSLVMKKGTKLDGSAPMLLYAYGSYGASMTPSFSSARFSLVDRGMIYAIAHIRGGSEMGEQWRQDGR